MSSSTAPLYADGTVAAVVDVVVGLSHVIGHGRALDVALLGEPTVHVRSDEPIALAEATDEAIRTTGRGCGFRSVAREPQVGRETIVYVLTDAVPVDVGAIRAARDRGENRCLVVAGHGRPSRSAPDVPTTVLAPPPRGTTATDHLLRQPDLLTDLVTSMLVAAGTVVHQ